MGSYAHPDLDIQDEITVLVTGFGVSCQIHSSSALALRLSTGSSPGTGFCTYNLSLII
jgi:hypothetical protein